MDLVLFGIQGSGKGTQSKIIADRFGLKVFETGGELRRLASEDNEMAKKVKAITEAGNLVPTEVVMDIIANFVNTIPQGSSVLFDGIPRSDDQKTQFDELMKKTNRNFVCLIIDLSKEEALKRLTTRRVCKQCKEVYPAYYDKDNCEKCGGELETRKDDTPDAIKVRLDTFFEKTMPILNDYKTSGLHHVITVNGALSIPQVTDEIISALTPYYNAN